MLVWSSSAHRFLLQLHVEEVDPVPSITTTNNATSNAGDVEARRSLYRWSLPFEVGALGQQFVKLRKVKNPRDCRVIRMETTLVEATTLISLHSVSGEVLDSCAYAIQNNYYHPIKIRQVLIDIFSSFSFLLFLCLWIYQVFVMDCAGERALGRRCCSLGRSKMWGETALCLR
jgi:hypothetical protein